MQRISTEQDGVFKNGVPGLRRGTRVNAEWFNALQEEICNLLEQNNVPLNPSSNTQLKSLFKDTLDRVFKSSVSVQDPLHSGVETTIDPDGIVINGIHISCVEQDEDLVLVIGKAVELAGALVVGSKLNVSGDSNFNGLVNIANATVRLLSVDDGIVCSGRFVAESDCNVNALTCNSAMVKKVVSVTNNIVEFNDVNANGFEIADSDFANGKLLRAVVVTGVLPAASKSLTINAMPVDGRSVNVVNLATGNGGYVYVKDSNNNVLCVLAPGVDRWFTVVGNVWMMDRNTIG